MRKRFILVAAAISCISACASIVSHSSWPVVIRSIPDRAKFTIINDKGVTVHSGMTPASVTLNGGAGYFDGATYHLKCSREGYKDTYSIIDSTVNGWYWGNILFGGIIGLLIIDPATGAMWKMPEYVNLELEPDK
ncbi:MAG: hypothetical protein ACU85E_11310 [Gammaproteobacteria bacterium]